MNQDLMSKDLTIEYNEFSNSIVIKEAGYEIEKVESERENKFGQPIFDLYGWNGWCSVSLTKKGDHFKLFLKLNNKYYNSFQKVDEASKFIIFRNFNEIEKVDGKWENKNGYWKKM